MLEDVFVPISLFGMIAAIVILPGYIRAQSRRHLMDTMRVAFERGQPVPPELIEAINTDPQAAALTPRARAVKDLRSGVITLAVALALLVFGLTLSLAGGGLVQDESVIYVFMGLAAFPGFIGLALIAFGLIGRGRDA